MEPAEGFEPPTAGLQIRRTTTYATLAYPRLRTPVLERRHVGKP